MSAVITRPPTCWGVLHNVSAPGLLLAQLWDKYLHDNVLMDLHAQVYLTLGGAADKVAQSCAVKTAAIADRSDRNAGVLTGPRVTGR